jgi:hypothetical protein
MVDFDPKFTEIVYVDIECYVPPEARQQSKGSMIFNPARHDFRLYVLETPLNSPKIENSRNTS